MNRLENINKKLGVSDKWAFLEGFQTGDGCENYEVYKFRNLNNFIEVYSLKDMSKTSGIEQSELYSWKSREESERIREWSSKTLIVIRVSAKGEKPQINKYYISLEAQNSEKYPHQIEGIIKELRKEVSNKSIFFHLEKYLRLEKYYSFWEIVPKNEEMKNFVYIEHEQTEMKYFSIHPYYGGAYTEGCKHIFENYIDFRTVNSYLTSSLYFEEGCEGFYSLPIEIYLNMTSLCSTIKDFVKENPYISSKDFKNFFREMINENKNCLLVKAIENEENYYEGIYILPSRMRNEIIDMFTEELSDKVLEKVKILRENQKKLIDSQDNYEISEIFEREYLDSEVAFGKLDFLFSFPSEKIFEKGNVINQDTINIIKNKNNHDTLISFPIDTDNNFIINYTFNSIDIREENQLTVYDYMSDLLSNSIKDFYDYKEIPFSVILYRKKDCKLVNIKSVELRSGLTYVSREKIFEALSLVFLNDIPYFNSIYFATINTEDKC